MSTLADYHARCIAAGVTSIHFWRCAAGWTISLLGRRHVQKVVDDRFAGGFERAAEAALDKYKSLSATLDKLDAAIERYEETERHAGGVSRMLGKLDDEEIERAGK